MTDLEICKRIAEIEGHKTKELPTGIKSIVVINPHLQSEDDCFTWYNPLTDKALCFDLMVKHKVEVEWWGNECGAYLDGLDGEIRDKNPQRAICLAIIEAHKECK